MADQHAGDNCRGQNQSDTSRGSRKSFKVHSRSILGKIQNDSNKKNQKSKSNIKKKQKQKKRDEERRRADKVESQNEVRIP